MALDINGYNATFKAFADFAAKSVEAGKGKAIARASADAATGALAGRDIKVATSDTLRGIFKWSRSDDDKAANDATRQLFKNAIIDMFGGESKIPAAVKKAMLMADYDCGKPLTARLILAVKIAIDASGTKEARKLDAFQSADAEKIALDMGYKKSELPKLARAAHAYARETGADEVEAMKAVHEKAKAATTEACARLLDGVKDIPEDRKAEYAKAIADVLVGPSDSSDTLEVLRGGKVLDGILYNFENKPRPPEDVAKRVAAIRDNVAELREATGGNQAKFKAALGNLVEFGGKAIPKGAITALVKAAQDMDVSSMKKLNRSSKPLDIHKAVRAFRNGLDRAIFDSGVFSKEKEGAQDLLNCKGLVSGFVFADMDAKTRNNIHAAVNSRNGQLMKCAYQQLTDGTLGWLDDYAEDSQNGISSIVFQLSLTLDSISDLTLDVPDGSGVDCPSIEELDVDITDLIHTVGNNAETEYNDEKAKFMAAQD